MAQAEGGRRGRPRNTDSIVTRERIVHAARAVFSARGYSSATNLQIARLAGVTRPAVSYYFRSRVDLYAAVVESIHDVVLLPATEHAYRADSALVARLTAFVKYAADVHAEDSSFARFIATSVVDADRQPRIAPVVAAQVNAVRDFLRDVVTESRERGELPAELEDEHAVELFTGLLWGLGLYGAVIGTQQQFMQLTTALSAVLNGTLPRR